jgi:hypothetical protein
MLLMRSSVVIVAFLSFILGPVPVASAKAKKDIETKQGTMLYLDHPKGVVLFYLNDAQNTVAILSDDVGASRSIFNQCEVSVPCLSLSLTVTRLGSSCNSQNPSFLVGMCAASKDILYATADIKGNKELGIATDQGTMLWIVPVYISVDDLARSDSAMSIQKLDPTFVPLTAHAWEIAISKLGADIREKVRQLKQKDKEASVKEYDCLTTLKQGQSVSTLMECSDKPYKINSDLHTDQLVYEVRVYGDDSDLGPIGTSEVLVYVEKSTHTIKDVQWSSEIKRP